MSRCGALCLLHGGGFHQCPEVSVDDLFLGVVRLEKAAQKHCRSGDVLASPSELWGIIPSVDYVVLDLTGATLSTTCGVMCVWRSMLCCAYVTQRPAPGIVPTMSCATSWMGGMIPHSSLGLSKTSPRRRCFYVNFPSQTTPRNRRSTGTSGHWWKPPPFNRWRALCCDTRSRHLSPLREWGRTSQITPFALHYSRRA